MAYAYHVFISYQYSPTFAYWVPNHFAPVLSEWLSQALAAKKLGPKAKICLAEEDIHFGDVWRKKLLAGLQTSCVLVPVFCPTYFDSAVCWAEWLTFRKREAALGNGNDGLVFPVIGSTGDNFPPEASAPQWANFTPHVTKCEAFRNTPEYRVFEALVQRLANDIALRLQKIPKFSDQWPVVDPDDPQVKANCAQYEPIIGMPSMAA